MPRNLTTEQAREMVAKRKHNNGGRKSRVEEQEIIAALDGTLPLGDVLSTFMGAVKRREPWAVQLWLAYRWGKPKEKQEISGPEGEAIYVNFVNDWRRQAADAPSGPADGDALEGPLSLADGRATLAQDDNGDDAGG